MRLCDLAWHTTCCFRPHAPEQGRAEKEFVMRGTRLSLAIGSAMIAGFVASGGCAPPPEPPEAAPPPVAEPAPAPAEATEAEAAEPAATESAPADASERPDVPPPGSPLERVMKAHFKDALLIREAVIRGKSEDAASPANALISIHDNLDDLPDGWRSYIERMIQAAGRVKDGTSASDVAAATADLGTSCGMCHQNQQKGPKASTEPAPVAGKSIESRMKVHAWATERLWEGLFVPSGDAWNAGAKALSIGPFPKEVLKEGGVHARSAASDFAKIVAEAPKKKTATDRAALYAELLVTCGKCHMAVGRDE